MSRLFWRVISVFVFALFSVTSAKAQTASNTYLYTSAYTVNAGDVVTLTVGVGGAAPTGSVTFKDGSTVLAVRPLASGSVDFGATFTTGGDHSITAIYSGDAANLPSTSTPLVLHIAHGVSSTLLAISPNPVAVGANFTLTATVTGSNPSGYASFYLDGVFLTTAGLTGNTASFIWSSYAPGTHAWKAVFADDYYNATSTSNTVNLLVGSQASSTTTLASSINPSALGQATNLVATVSGSGVTGTVTFKDGATTLGSSTVSAGTASLSKSFSSLGSHSLTASYSGDSSNTASTSGALSQTVNAVAVTSTTLASSVNPAAVGQLTTLTATVSGFSPTGNVVFKDGVTVLGTVALTAGSATLSTSFVAAGTHSLTAAYAGDASNAVSTSAGVTQTVNALTPTTTTLASTVNPSIVGQTTVLTAVVSGAAGGGSVTFKDGATTLGTSVLSGTTATLNTSFATAGAHSLTAVFLGNASSATSTSAALPQTVNAKAVTSTSLATSLNPSGIGQSTTLTATVTGSSPTGSVTFMDGAASLGSASISAGRATLAVSFSVAGAHSLTAQYPGDGSNTASSSTALAQTVNALASSATTLASSANPAFVAQNTTLTATVTGLSPTGSVTFKDGATTLGSGTVTAGVATLSTTFSVTGAHALTAVYPGDSGNAASTSSSLTQNISAKSSPTTALASSINPAFVNQPVNLTATVSGSSPTGTVTFKDGAATLGSASVVSGVASLATSFATTGAHSLTFVYSGDVGNNSATSAALVQTVNPRGASTTSLASSVNPAFVGQNTVLTATVAGASPSGTVTFKDGAATLGTASLSSGAATLTISFSAAGTHILTASYAGDAGNLSSASTNLSQTVNAQTSSATVLISSNNPSITGQSTTLTATVTGSSPSGTVTFKDGATSLGSATLAAGVASLSTAFSVTGAHGLTAIYSGNAGNTASTSASLTQTVNGKAASTTTLSSSLNPAGINQSITITANVSGASPTGNVLFYDNGAFVQQVALSAGAATIQLSYTSAATHSLTASYAGDASNNGSASSALSQVVNTQATTTTTVTSSTNPMPITDGLSLTATVYGSYPTGTVTFKDGAVTIGTATLSGSFASATASISKTFSSVGAHIITAQYSGDTGNVASTSPPLTQTISKANAAVSVSFSPNPVCVGCTSSIRASVLGSSPTGTVTFFQDGVNIGSRTLSAGLVSIASPVFSDVGSKTYTASYSGDANNASATSAAATLTGVAGPTSTGLVVTPGAPVVGQAVTLTANIDGYAPGGTVVFKDGAVVLGTQTIATTAVGSPSTVSLSTSFSTTGTKTLTANYSGDSRNQASIGTQAVIVGLAPSTTSLSATPSPAIVGQSTVLTATVVGASPTGTVTFKDGGTSIGTAAVSAGTATLSTSFAAAGTHNLSASYGGDARNSGSNSTVTVLTAQAMTTVTFGAVPSPVRATISSAFPLTVAGLSPGGTVTVKEGSTVKSTCVVSSGACQAYVAFPTAGTYSLVATYAGDSNNLPATSAPLAVTVVQKPLPALSLTSSVPSVALNQSVTLTASFQQGGVTGTMSFKVGPTLIATQPLNGVITDVSISPSFQSSGSYSIVAVYSGDSVWAPATSAPVVVQVGGPPPGDMKWLFGYDPKGNPTSVIDPNGNLSTTAYDQLQRPTVVTQPAPGLAITPPNITFAYDGQDNVTSVKDPRNLITSYTLDGLANTKTQVSPDTKTTNATYDAAGNLLTSTDARGKTTTYTYDVLNRVKTISYPTGTGTTFEYDGGSAPYPGSVGKLTKVTDESGVTSFGYDALGRVISRSALVAGKTITTGYSWGISGIATGRLATITYPSGARVNYAYDPAGRVQALTLNPPNTNGVGTNTSGYLPLLAGITYNAESNITGWTWADNAPYQRTYDSFGRLSSYPVGYPLGSGIAAGLTRTLAYDSASRITGYAHSNISGAQAAFNQGFGYDGLDRLTQQTTTALNYGYGYDATGNRTSLTVGGNVYANSVDPASNRLTVVQTAGTGNTIVNNTQSYTTSGSLTGDGSVTYSYSDRGRLSTSTYAGQVTTYRYNGLEQRMSKTGPLVSTGAAYYAYDEGGQTLGEYDASLNPVAETVYLGTTPVAVLKLTGSAAALTLQINVGNVYADQIDTPRVITRNSDEAILWRWDATEAFGNSTPSENPSGLGAYKYNQRMPGQVFDPETNNFYNFNRDYSPGRGGRYIQSDPIGLAGGVNTYTYVEGNPLSVVDPEGLMGRGGMPSTPGPRTAAPCACSEIQASLGAGGLTGFGPTIVPAGFVGLGVGFGFTTSGMFFVQGQGTLAAGAGVFAGGGAQLGVTRNITQTRPGFSDSYSIQGDANFGAGPSVGGSVQISPDGAGVQTGIGRLGVGYGAQASIGVTRTLTYAWQILPNLRCACCP